MGHSSYLAWRYLIYQWRKTAILVCSVTLILYLPGAMQVLVDHAARHVRSRAEETPLIVGARGSALQLVLNSIYFTPTPPEIITFAEVENIRSTDLATPIPVYARFTARGQRIVGTSLEYFSFRNLRIAEGRLPSILGECVIGSGVARELNLQSGDELVSTPENPFDLAGVYPLKMRVVGLFSPTDTADDDAIFVDLKTVWIIEGLGHGHQDLTRPDSAPLLLDGSDDSVTANAAVPQYTEITPVNLHSFHFHGDQSEFPITAVIAVPHDDKSAALLRGRYESSSRDTQVVVPATAVEELLTAMFRIRRLLQTATALVEVGTLLTIVLVFMLSVRLREREFETMRKLGCSRRLMGQLLACEATIILIISSLLAGSMLLLTSQYGDVVLQRLILTNA